MQFKKTIAILGPTCSGKTKLSIEIATKLNLNIVNCDSCQFIKYMPQLTASPTEEEKKSVPHYLFNEIDHLGSLGWWVDQIKTIPNKLIVGGTIFYPMNLAKGIPLYTLDEIEEATWEDLYKLNPIVANKIHTNNKYRINCHFNFIKKYNKSFDEYENKYKEDIFFIVVNPPTEELTQLITIRTKELINRSLDAKEFLENPILNRLIGYKEIALFKLGQINYKEVVDLTTQKTIQYMKAQKKLLKKIKPDILLKNVEDYDGIFDYSKV